MFITICLPQQRASKFHPRKRRFLCYILGSKTPPKNDNVMFLLPPPARPSVLLPEKAAVTEGEEKTIQCDVTGFYPEKLAVTWLTLSGSRTVLAGLSPLSRVCTEMAIHNADGTFSIRSGITMHSSAVKGGEMSLMCQVEHKTYSRPYSTSVTLTVQGAAFSPFCHYVHSSNRVSY